MEETCKYKKPCPSNCVRYKRQNKTLCRDPPKYKSHGKYNIFVIKKQLEKYLDEKEMNNAKVSAYIYSRNHFSSEELRLLPKVILYLQNWKKTVSLTEFETELHNNVGLDKIMNDKNSFDYYDIFQINFGTVLEKAYDLLKILVLEPKEFAYTMVRVPTEKKLTQIMEKKNVPKETIRNALKNLNNYITLKNYIPHYQVKKIEKILDNIHTFLREYKGNNYENALNKYLEQKDIDLCEIFFTYLEKKDVNKMFQFTDIRKKSQNFCYRLAFKLLQKEEDVINDYLSIS